jgi:alpha-ribazole phosphatase/probable phosphoglycerate mutase
MSLTIVFETHATTLDNEAGLASGRSDGPLSSLGEEQARALGARRRNESIDAIFASDLERSRRTAQLAFAERGVLIECDERLREIDYGSLTCQPNGVIHAVRARHIDIPFPGGESYREVTARVADYLADMRRRFPRGRIVVIGHSATHVALEQLLAGRPIEETLAAPFTWQPGWEYVDRR